MNIMTFTHRTLPTIITGTLFFILFFLFFQSAYASNVSARFFQDNGTVSVIEINTGKPSPTTLIVQMKLPHGIKVVGSTPDIAKINVKKNTVKWLLREVTSGRSIISVITSRPLNPNNASVIIRYRNKGQGDMVEIEAVKE